MFDLVIRGGDVVTLQSIGKWTGGVKDGRIATVGLDQRPIEAGRMIGWGS